MPYKDRGVRLAYLREYHKKRVQENPQYNAECYQKYNGYLAHKIYKANHPERMAAHWKKYKQVHSGWWNAYVAKRNADKIQAIPRWLTKEQLEEMKQFYINCPEGYEVDHIFPLRGKGSRGLHVPWNLQYLTKTENCSKGNRLDWQN